MWTKYGIIVLVIIVFMTVSFFGAKAGFTVNGVPQGGQTEFSPSTMIDYFWGLCSFSVDGVPGWESIIFDILIILLAVLITTEFGIVGTIAGAIAGLGMAIIHWLG